MNVYLTIKEQAAWNNFIRRSLKYDVYHLWQYHVIDQSGEPVMFVYQNDDLFIALPLIKRKISGSDWFDLTCVYGYGGPISNQNFDTLKEKHLVNFRLQFLDFMEKEHCICVFSRLHPFLDQHYLLQHVGGVSGNGKTLFIDLSISHEEQIERYEKRMARQIRRLRRMPYQILDERTDEAVSIFHKMYTENMVRVSASENYFFTEEYFANLLEKNKENTKLIMVYENGVPATGAIIFHTDYIIRNHLSATAENYLKESPGKLLTDEISLIGREMGIKYMHLGGGVGGQEDSLYIYKSYFTNQTIDDYIWRFIANEDAYNALVEIRGFAANNHSNFFPLYRSRIAEVLE